MLGRISKKLGFKHGSHGLEYVIRDHTLNSDSRVKDTILLSTDPYKILEILDVSVERFKEGFDDHISMFDYIASSPYFDPRIFHLDVLTNKDRVRDRKRDSYRKFLEYCDTKMELVPAYPYLTDRSITPIKWFPFLQQEIDRVYKEVEDLNAFRAKFNGKLVMDLTGLDGKELGVFLTKFRDKYTDQEIINSNNINELVLQLHNQS